MFTPSQVKPLTARFPVKNIEGLKQQMLSWVSRFNICCFLDNHNYNTGNTAVECLAAAGALQVFHPTKNILPQLREFCNRQDGWLFGHIGYDLKNEIHHLQSAHPDHIGFPDIFFFAPEIVLRLDEEQLTIISHTEEPVIIFSRIRQESPGHSSSLHIFPVQPRLSKQEYLDAIGNIAQHIHRGDCYELNFCQEFFATNISIDPAAIYTALTKISPNPFSCFYKTDQKYLLCASPERYLQKKGERIISQPIKGTLRRDTNQQVDDQLKEQLHHSAKDRSENVMVVDLVRNDLSKVCVEGSVKVDELFGVYSFPQVHQMISTVSGQLKPDAGLADILEASFPMGSMTGAPKTSVMQLIERYEKTKRGIYSGAVGYINPEKDFDFNVVIRSILYNAEAKYLSYLVGGGITAYSDPEKEYEECLLKAEAINKVLTGRK